jgi:uncharacterized membrane protein
VLRPGRLSGLSALLSGLSVLRACTTVPIWRSRCRVLGNRCRHMCLGTRLGRLLLWTCLHDAGVGASRGLMVLVVALPLVPTLFSTALCLLCFGRAPCVRIVPTRLLSASQP